MKSTCVRRMLAVMLLAGLLAVLAAAAQKTDDPEVLLQAAQAKQLVDGQLEDAIQLYKRILTEHPGNRAVAAQALLEIGQCYEKLGNGEARKAYERLLREYGDQDEAVAAARKRLAALGRPSGSSNPSEMVARRIWAGTGDLVYGNPSPDGRYLSYVDDMTGELTLHDFATGKTRQLVSRDPSNESGGAPYFSAISPNGKEIAYSWFGNHGTELRFVRVDGSAPRALFHNQGVVALPTWSPDGKTLLCIVLKFENRVAGKPQIALISVADGSIRALKTLERGFPGKMWFSPDGRYIAYDFPPHEGSDNRDIFLLSVQDGRDIPLVEHPADDVLLGWTPAGDYILFASDRSGSNSAWILRVADGKPVGSPELVKQDIGQALPIGFTRSGSYYYGLAIGTSDIYSAEFDPASGKVVGQTQKATQRFTGSNFAPAFSPDGQYLAYRSSRTGPQVVIGFRPEVISIRSLKTGEERDLSPNLMESWGPIRWFPDGRSLFLTGKDKKLKHGIFRIDIQSGETTPALQPEGGFEIFSPSWLPDGKRLLYIKWHQESGAIAASVVVRDFDSGRTTELFKTTPGLTIDDIALSPDGQQLALTLLEKETRSSALKVLPLAGGEAKKLARAKKPETIVGDSLSWSADSRYIVFGKSQGAGQQQKVQLLAIPSRGGEPHALGLSMDYVRHISFHPDGRHLAFSASAGRNKAEVWVMENFLPTLKAARQGR